MNLRVVVLALWVLLAPASVRAADEEPSREEVLEALRTYLAGPEDEPGEARFKAWGDTALGRLRALADDPEGVRHVHRISSAVQVVGTKKAADLFVTLLAGKTSLPGYMVLMTLETHSYLHNPTFLAHLDEHEGFQDAVWLYAKGTFRARVAKVSAAMGWVGAAPRIRAMLEDPDLDVRVAAAEALRELTGEESQVERPDLDFPAEDLRPELLGEAVVLPTQGRRDPDFVAAMPWFDGKPRLVSGFGPGLESFGDRGELCITTGDLAEPARWPMPYDLHALACAPIPAGGLQLVGLVDDREAEKSWQTVVAWSAEGLERWRVKTPERFLKDVVVLHGQDGPIGFAIAAGGDTGLVAVDLEGKPLWNVPRQFVLYGLGTHPRLPGYVLAVGGGAVVFRHTNKQVGVHYATPRTFGIYVGHGVLFPDSEGKPALVLAGKVHKGDLPTLRRIDGKGRTIWNVVFPVQIEGLALLEPQGGPRLLAVTTERGELFLVDDAGTLRWRGETPEADSEDRVATYQLAAGEIGPGEYGVLVRLLGDSYLYRLDLNALKEPVKK